MGDRRAFGLVAADVAGLGTAELAMNMLLALVREWKESTNESMLVKFDFAWISRKSTDLHPRLAIKLSLFRLVL